MTKQEIKEEYKQQEGDPQIKSKIRQRQREMAIKKNDASSSRCYSGSYKSNSY